jgi:hypothetical protein
MPRPDSSVVERGPEKAGVGGSIPSLATIIFNYLAKSLQKPDPLSTRDWFCGFNFRYGRRPIADTGLDSWNASGTEDAYWLSISTAMWVRAFGCLFGWG